MSIDLTELVPSLMREVSPPGTDLFPEARPDEYAGYLTDAFWEAYLDGLLPGWIEADGEVSPRSGSTDFPRELQQLVVFYAGVRIIRNHLTNLNTKTRSKAGPVEYEVEKSATLCRDLLAELQRRRTVLLDRLGDMGMCPSYVIDGIRARTESYRYGDSDWPSSFGGGVGDDWA